jgi:hypothetical protein
MKRTPLANIQDQVFVIPSQNPRMDVAERGAALIVVLAFMAMLLVLLMAFFSKSSLHQQVSKSSENLGIADIFAQGAVDTIIGDLKKEIADNSIPTVIVTQSGSDTVTNTLYYPPDSSKAVPRLEGCATNLIFPNLVKVSANKTYTNYNTNYETNYITNGTDVKTNFITNVITNVIALSRATTNSTTNSSFNGRFISTARWNKALFMPIISTENAFDLTPSDQFVPPTWILVTRGGTNSMNGKTNWDTNAVWSSTNSGTVIGRYAYTIYNEGGVLDVNVAGYPQVPLTSLAIGSIASVNHILTNAATKRSLSYADLTNFPTVISPKSLIKLLNWRNAATLQAAAAPGAASSTVYPTALGITNYVSMVASVTNGFLASAPTSYVTGGNTITDRQFVNRQQLISFFYNQLGANADLDLVNSLQYLGTFSRGLDQPSYAPAAGRPKVLTAALGGTAANGQDDAINPAFLTLRSTTNFTVTNPLGVVETHRLGDPLVKKRFPLNRLVWLTYKGPSADRTVPPGSNSTSTGVDQDMWLLVNKYGISTNYLAQGTSNNIRRYFGLTWDGTKNAWTYVHNDDGAGTGAAIKNLSDVAGLSSTSAREPDFFELLKATIGVGSLGNALLNSSSALTAPGGALQGEVPENWQYKRDISYDAQIIQIGANIINQSRCDNFPILINFNEGPQPDGTTLGNRQFAGIANLPYINNIVNGILQVKLPLNQLGKTQTPGNDDVGVNVQAPATNTDSTYGQLADPGLGAVMQFPVLWNPHSVNSPFPATGIRPTFFRVVADTTTPNNVNNTGDNYWSVTTFAKSGLGVKGASLPVDSPAYSFNADPANSPLKTVNKDFNYTQGDIGKLTADNSALVFQIPSSSLFREPTVLYRPNFPTGSTLKATPNHRIITNAPVSNFYDSAKGGLPSAVKDPCGFVTVSSTAGTYHSNNATSFLGFYLGSYPLRWIAKGTNNNLYAMTSSSDGGGVYVARATQAPNTSDKLNNVSTGSLYFTYRVQYSTNQTDWYTYDTKYGKYSSGTSSGWDGGQAPMIGYINAQTLFNGYDRSTPGKTGGAQMPGDSGYWCSAIDPRTGRFGLVTTAHERANNGGGHGFCFGWRSREACFNPVSLGSGNLYSTWGWIDYKEGVTGTLRPFAQAGAYTDSWKDFQAFMPRWNFQQSFVQGDGFGAGLMAPIGSLEQNNSDSWTSYQAAYINSMSACQVAPFYYADPDGVVRRASGAYVPRIRDNQDPNLPLVQANSTMTIDFGDAVQNIISSPNLAPACTTVGLPLARATKGSFPLTSDGTQTDNTNSKPAISNYSYQDQSRPYYLNRPYRTVAELGCVFRDTPWKNLDFFTPESADNALLDVFTINESDDPSGLVAGKVDLNTRQQPVLQAVLSGGALDDAQTGLGLNTPAAFMTNAFASNVATALINRTTNSAAFGPLVNPADLVGHFVAFNKIKPVEMHVYVSLGKTGKINVSPSDSLLTLENKFCDGKLSYDGFVGGAWNSVNGAPKISYPATDIISAASDDSVYTANATLNGVRETVCYAQRFHEAPIRALAACGQTRVWNLMIDVVAQTGKYPASATKLDDFLVEGEQRYWVHVAIDRLTGQVLDKQIEVVKE